MSLDGSPKKFALDIASGLFSLNRSTIKRLTHPEILKVQVGLQTVMAELRTQAVDSGDYQAMKDKGMRTQRVNGALRVIQTYLREMKNSPR